MSRYRFYHNRRQLWRRLAPLVTLCFAGSFVLGPVAQALANQPPRPSGHTRKLSTREMHQIVGATSGTPVPASPGSSYPWEGRVGDVNTANGDKLTSIPITGWRAKGGLPVVFTLYHNSQSSHNAELGQKWTFSLGISASVDGSGNFSVQWGDGLTYQFTKNLNGTYSAPTGIHDSLLANGSPITSYDLTTPDQTKYHFTNPNGTAWLVSSISDPNGNTIAVNHNTSNLVTTRRRSVLQRQPHDHARIRWQQPH